MAEELPIHDCADALAAGVRETGRVVLSAPTGSGKSTQAPQILLDRAGIAGEIVVLQPRRIAARMLARRVAVERGGNVGDEVGYQVRFEKHVSANTRIRYVTEGILLRRILGDPELAGVGALVFDEFHERNVDGDVALACAWRALKERRPDLALVVMSATLETEPVAAYLAPARRVEASGRLYPVATEYFGAALNRGAPPVWERAARAFRDVARRGLEGDVLVFMPGAFEIRRTIEAIQATPESADRDVLPLHGELSPEAQDRAVAPGDRPRVIVATNVAETSLTIAGVRAVIDSGLARQAAYDPVRGVDSLLVQPIGRASADQRAGRAGRVAPGLCVRLWSEAEHARRPERETPEIRRVDLSETRLLLASAELEPIDAFPWFDRPPEQAMEASRERLRDLGAFDASGRLTETGRAMARFPLHPRYSRMLLEAGRCGVAPSVALIGALSQGRPVYRPSRDTGIRRAQEDAIESAGDTDSDWFVQLRAWNEARARNFDRRACERYGIHAQAARQAGRVAEQLLATARDNGVNVQESAGDDANAMIRRCLLAAFSDRLAKRLNRGTRRCALVHERTGELRRESVVEADLFVASEIEERDVRGGVDLLLGMASKVDPAWLGELFPDALETTDATRYEASGRKVSRKRERRFRDLVLDDAEAGDPDPGRAAELLAEEVMAGRLTLKHWTQAAENFIRRVNFVARHAPSTGIAPIDGAARRMLAEQLCEGATNYKQIKDRAVVPVLEQWLAPGQRHWLDVYAPESIRLPSRSKPFPIRYQEDGRAVLSARIQDLYEVAGEQLRVGPGGASLTVELLAPNGRPVQVTDDLDGFWERSYPQVRKELAGRYPKHEWR